MIRTVRFVVLSIVFCAVTNVFAGEKDPVRLLVFSAGGYHAYGQCSGIFFDYLRKEGGFLPEYSENPESLKYGNLKQFDVLMVFACEYYKAGDHNVPTPDFVPESLTRFVDNGGGLICVHSGIATFSDWKGFINLTGGVWDWEKSAHDAYGPLKSTVVSKHPILEGIPPTFEFTDEFYHTLTLLPTIETLIESTHEKDGKQVTEPLAWIALDTDKKRSVSILHGHDTVSWNHPVFQHLMKQTVEWAARRR